MIRKLWRWIFKSELQELEAQIRKAKDACVNCETQEKRLKRLLTNIDVSVDVYEYRHLRSWAVISLQGQKTDYIKFVDLGDRDIQQIAAFIRQFERNTRVKVDASPSASRFLRIRSNRF